VPFSADEGHVVTGAGHSSCSFIRVSDPVTWDSLLSRVEHPHMTQSWAYGDAKEATRGAPTGRRGDVGGWRVRRLLIERDDEPVAICQLLDKSLRCASRLNRGPLFLRSDVSDEVVRDVYRALRARWRHLRGVLVLAPALLAGGENERLLTELGFRARRQAGWCSNRLDLCVEEEQLRRNLAPTWRNRLNAAERSRLVLTVSQAPEDVEWMIECHVQNMKEKDFVGPAPALIRELYHAAPRDLLVFQARLDDRPVGAMAIYRFGRGAEYYIGWMGREGREVNVGNFLFWRIALELRRLGCLWFDLGGGLRDKRHRIGHFKAGMRGQEYELLNEWLAF
jgi:hypothetical protein